jgi:hypothetical protein
MRSASFTLARDGDPEERVAQLLFLNAEFPQYEKFWRLFVVGLTGRVHDVTQIGFRPQAELDAEGRSEWHVEVAQLHYTTLLHLRRVFDLRREGIWNRDRFLEAIVRLDAATDTAFELLGHCLIDRGKSLPWDEIAGQKVRKSWGKKAGQPLKALQDYRNCLLHARMRLEYPVILDIDGRQTTIPFYTTFGKMLNSLDWREATIEHAAPVDALVDEAWAQVLDYFRHAWAEELLPWAQAAFSAPEVPVTLPAMPFSTPAARSLSADAPPTYTGGSISHSPTIATMTNPPSPGK